MFLTIVGVDMFLTMYVSNSIATTYVENFAYLKKKVIIYYIDLIC